MKQVSHAVGCIVAVIATFCCANQARAGGVVGTGTPDTCTEAALDAALAGGGSVTFDCGASPLTLTVSTARTIAVPTSIDGGGLITISGGGSTLIFAVNEHVTLSVAGLTLSDGSGGSAGGAVYNTGALTVTNSTFINNSGVNGGAIFNRLGPDAWSGGSRRNSGTLTVRDSTFTDNRAVGPSNVVAMGGAIVNGAKAKLTVTGSTFTNNSAQYDGGAISNQHDSKLTVTNSTFTNNDAVTLTGGAISNGYGSKFTVTSSTFTDNTAQLQGGAIEGVSEGPTVIVTNSTFVGNSCRDSFGGAIFNPYHGKLKVTNSTFVNNSAFGGGAIINWDNGDWARLTVANSTFSSNIATGSWGGGAISTSDVRPRVKNTILANSTGGNCSGAKPRISHIIDSDGTCGDDPATDPMLDPLGLADHGGPTQTIAVQPGSPAINVAPRTTRTDQRGYVRPGTGAAKCTIGAYEFNSPGCPAKLTACGAMSICSNLRTDPNNCGACGNGCGATQKCAMGICN